MGRVMSYAHDIIMMIDFCYISMLWEPAPALIEPPNLYVYLHPVQLNFPLNHTLSSSMVC